MRLSSCFTEFQKYWPFDQNLFSERWLKHTVTLGAITQPLYIRILWNFNTTSMMGVGLNPLKT